MSSIEDLTRRVEALELEVKELKEDPEMWVPIKDNWAYFISNKGRVKRYDGFMPKIGLNRSRGYYQVALNRKPYKLHRLLAQAFIPNPENKPQVDHIDGDRLNNDLSNLRWATATENMRNRKKHSNNTSDYTGVTFDKRAGKWRAYVNIDGKKRHLGYFHAKEEASVVYEKAAREEFGEFFREE